MSIRLSDILSNAYQGIQGVQGTQGIQGIQGLQGPQGVQGTQGIIGESYWTSTSAGINALSNTVGIGTTNPRFTLEVGSVGASGTSLYVNGNTVVTGNVSVAGTLTYEDVTNVDSIGLVTARAGAHVATSSGSLLVGSATETGTASQRLQVTGGAYVSGNLGIAHTRPTSRLDVVGDAQVSGVVTATTFNGQINAGVSTISVNSASDALRITQTGAGNALVVEDSANPDATPFVVSSTGAVGIATTIPSHALDVVGRAVIGGTGVDSALYMRRVTDNTVGLAFGYAATNSNGEVSLRHNAGTGNFTIHLNGTGGEQGNGYNEKFKFTSAGQLGIGRSNPSTELDVFGGANFTNRVLIGSATSTGTASQTLQVTGGAYVSGNVGAGTTNPRFKLEVGSVGASGTSLYVNGDARITGILTVGSSSITLDGTDNQINVGTGVTIHHTNGVQVGPNVVHSTGLTINNLNISGVSTFTNGPVLVGSGTSTGTASQRLQVTGGAYVSGNLGVGFTNPLANLHIRTTSGTTPCLVLPDATNPRYSVGFGNVNISGVGQRLDFYAGDSGSNSSNLNSTHLRMSLTATGNLGIGITNPDRKFVVSGDTNITGYQYKGATIKTATLFVRGTGLNANANRLVYLNDTAIVNSGSRGLTLTIIGADLTNVSNTNYDTFGSTIDSDNLATAITNLSTGQIAVLTSYDAWEASVTNNLRASALKVGLSKLGSYSASGSRRPYAAVFYGSSDDPNAAPHDVIERMESDDADAPRATIFCNLATEGNSIGILGATSVNALYSSQSNTENPVVIVSSSDNVGIGTENPAYKLDVVGDINLTGSLYQNGVPLASGTSVGRVYFSANS